MVVKAVASYKFTLAFNLFSSSSKNNHTFFIQDSSNSPKTSTYHKRRIFSPLFAAFHTHPSKKIKLVFLLARPFSCFHNCLTGVKTQRFFFLFVCFFPSNSDLRHMTSLLQAGLCSPGFPTVGRLFFPVGRYRTLAPVYLCPQL